MLCPDRTTASSPEPATSPSHYSTYDDDADIPSLDPTTPPDHNDVFDEDFGEDDLMDTTHSAEEDDEVEVKDEFADYPIDRHYAYGRTSAWRAALPPPVVTRPTSRSHVPWSAPCSADADVSGSNPSSAASSPRRHHLTADNGTGRTRARYIAVAAGRRAPPPQAMIPQAAAAAEQPTRRGRGSRGLPRASSSHSGKSAASSESGSWSEDDNGSDVELDMPSRRAGSTSSSGSRVPSASGIGRRHSATSANGGLGPDIAGTIVVTTANGKVVRRYPCKEAGCKRSFTRLFNLKAHLETHNPQRERSFKCADCGVAFCRAQDLLRHGTVHDKSNLMLCAVMFVSMDAAQLRVYKIIYHMRYDCGNVFSFFLIPNYPALEMKFSLLSYSLDLRKEEDGAETRKGEVGDGGKAATSADDDVKALLEAAEVLPSPTGSITMVGVPLDELIKLLRKGSLREGEESKLL
ncbi:Metallothionein expression activator, partial [Irineochytrium annulatum]